MEASKGLQVVPCSFSTRVAWDTALDNVVSLRTVHGLDFRPGRIVSNYLVFSISFTKRKVKFREAMSFIQGHQAGNSRPGERTELSLLETMFHISLEDSGSGF